jgi:hypothetical protein
MVSTSSLTSKGNIALGAGRANTHRCFGCQLLFLHMYTECPEFGTDLPKRLLDADPFRSLVH